MEEYVRRRQNTVSQYITTPSLLELCEGSERAPGTQVWMWWWEQAGLSLVGEREVAVTAAERDGGEE